MRCLCESICLHVVFRDNILMCNFVIVFYFVLRYGMNSILGYIYSSDEPIHTSLNFSGQLIFWLPRQLVTYNMATFGTKFFSLNFVIVSYLCIFMLKTKK